MTEVVVLYLNNKLHPQKAKYNENKIDTNSFVWLLSNQFGTLWKKEVFYFDSIYTRCKFQKFEMLRSQKCDLSHFHQEATDVWNQNLSGKIQTEYKGIRNILYFKLKTSVV